MRIVIIGGGIAAAYMANLILDQAPKHEVLIVSKESNPPYDRIHLCSLISGTSDIKDIALPLPPGVKLELDSEVIKIDKDAKRIYTKNSSFSYDILIIATGSEVALATGAAEAMSGKNIRVVSMPSTNVFEQQDDDYQTAVLGMGIATVAVEAAVTDGWYKYADVVVGIDHFGESAPAPELFKEFGFTVENVVSAVESII